MKRLNKILCGCALVTMAASLGVAFSQDSEATSVKASDYTQHEAYFYKAEVEASGNFYIFFAADGGEGVNAPAVADASPNATILDERLAEFNFLDKISLTIDGVETFLRDVKTAGSACFNKFTRWGCYGMNIDPTFASEFVAKKEEGKFENSLLTVYEGCELPTFDYGIGASDTKESILTPVRSFIDISRGGNVTQSFKIKGDIAIGSAYTSGNRTQSGCNFGAGHKNLDLTFQYNDYEGYDTTANLTLNGLAAPLAAKEKIAVNGKTFDYYIEKAYEAGTGTDQLIQVVNNHYARPGCCVVDFNYFEDDITSFDIKKGMIIPQGNGNGFYDYDWNTAQSHFNEIKAACNVPAYAVDRDYHFVANGITGFSDQNLTIFHEHNNVTLGKARLVQWSDQGYMLSFTGTPALNSRSDFYGCDGDFIKNYTWQNIELYAGEEKLDFTYGEQFFNLWQAGDFTTRVRHGDDTFGRLGEVTKIVVKAGMEFPDGDYCSRYNAENNPAGQVVNPGCEARKNAGCYYIENDIELVKLGDTFVPINHREFDSTNEKEINIEKAYLRTDGNIHFLQILVPDSEMNYGAAENGGIFLPENELYNLNTLEKIHLIHVDGSDIKLTMDMIETVRYQQWGNPDLFIQFKESINPSKLLNGIREIVLDEGLELPDYNSNIKLVSKTKLDLRYVNGSKYPVDGGEALGHWWTSWESLGNKDYIKMNKVHKGNVSVKVIGDGDPNEGVKRIWLQPFDGSGNLLYSGFAHNTHTPYSLIFNLNILGKVVLIKGDVETRLSDFYYGDDCCTINIWDRPDGTITIKPMNSGFSYKNYDAIRLEAGLELPVGGFNVTDSTSPIEYYTLGETVTWYYNNQNGYGFQKTATFDETVLNTVTGGKITNAPAVPVEEGHIGYWEDSTNALFDPNHIVADNEVYHSYQSEIKAVTPVRVGGVRGDAGGSTNIVFTLDGSDYGDATENINVADFETFSSHLELYDMAGNLLPVNLNHERYIWSNGDLLIQLLDPESSFLHRIYKVVLKAGAVAPSLSFLKTGEGPTYTLDKDYAFVRLPVTDTWELVKEPTEVIATKVTSFSLGVNNNPAGSCNVILGLDGYVAGNLKTSAKMLLDVYDNIHFYKADGSEMALSYNTEQYSSWDGNGVLYQIFSEEAPAKVVLDEGMLIPSAAYVEGSGAMLKLSEEAVLLRQEDGSYNFVKEYTFDGESVYFTYGQCPDVSKIPTPKAKDPTATVEYVSYWKDSLGNALDTTLPVTSDMTFTTDYKEEARKYSVTYIDENGTEIETVSVANASEYTIKEAPTKTGHTGSWVVESGGVEIVNGKFTMPANNVVLKQSFVANTYTLSFQGIDQTITVTYGQPVGNLPSVPAKEHFKDGVWMLGDTVLTAETIWTFTEDMKATPSYTKESYTVTFDTDGGTEISSQTVEYLGKVTAVADPTKTGYTFAGWEVNGQAVDLTTYEVTGNVTITAKWTINVYTVTFVSDGETVGTDSVNYNAKAAEPTAPAKAGYTFAGWTLDGEDYDFNTPVTGNITLVAKWTINSYTVTFQNGDSEHTSTVTHGEVVNAPTMPVKEGYTFKGWTLDGEVYDFNTPVTGDITLVASWELNKYTVTFVDGETILGTQVVEHGGLVEEPTMPVKEGYTFEGWLVNGEVYDFSTPVTGDMTISVSWKEIPAEPEEPAKKGCKGSVVAASAIVTLVAGLGVALVANKKKED